MSILRYAPFALLALASGCVVPASAVPNFPGQEAAQATADPAPGWRTNPPAAGPANQVPSMAGADGQDVPLYARDGSVVKGIDGGATQQEDVFSHEMEPTSTGRMYILELYQNSLDEIDALEAELANLGADYSTLEGRLQNTQLELAGAVALGAANRQEADELLGENGELAARLTTAQIRRLEAESMLLGAKLELLRLTERSSGPTASTEPATRSSVPASMPDHAHGAETHSPSPGGL